MVYELGKLITRTIMNIVETLKKIVEILYLLSDNGNLFTLSVSKVQSLHHF